MRERSIELPIDAVSRDLSHAPEAGGARVVRLEIGVPSPLLARGLVVVDTPGTGGVGNPHASGTLGLLASSDAIVIASDVSQEYTAPEMSFIRQANELCGNALVVGTKTDLYPMWREVVDADIAHLRKQGTDLTPLPVSSVLRDHAIRLNDTELNDESGFPAILEFLHTKVIAQATARMQKLVMAEIGSSAEHLAPSWKRPVIRLRARRSSPNSTEPASRPRNCRRDRRCGSRCSTTAWPTCPQMPTTTCGCAPARCSRSTRPESIPVIRPRCGTNWVKNSRTRSPKV